MTRNPEWERAREACADLAAWHGCNPEAVADIRALPVPEPAPDPRDAEIAALHAVFAAERLERRALRNLDVAEQMMCRAQDRDDPNLTQYEREHSLAAADADKASQVADTARAALARSAP